MAESNEKALTFSMHDEGPTDGPFITIEIKATGDVDVHAARFEKASDVGVVLLEIARAMAAAESEQQTAEAEEAVIDDPVRPPFAPKPV